MPALARRPLAVMLAATPFFSLFSCHGHLPAHAGDLVNLRDDAPEVCFDVPRSVIARNVFLSGDEAPLLAPGQRLVTVDLPVTVVVAKGDVGRVDEVVIEIDGASAGLTVHDYSPATRLESEYAGDIQVQSTTEDNRHLDATLGGILPSPGGSVAQLAPSAAAGVIKREAETEKLARLAPKEAIVVAGAVNRRQGVLFKFRPSSQTTLEGERLLSITFAAPADWTGGELLVDCQARGDRRVLFVTQQKTWGAARAPVRVALAGARPSVSGPTGVSRQTVAKPVVEEKSAESTDGRGLMWKRRSYTDDFASERGSRATR